MQWGFVQLYACIAHAHCLVYVFLASFCLLLLVIGSIVKAGWADTVGHDKTNPVRYRHTEHYLETKVQSYTLFIILITVYIRSGVTQGIILLLATLTVTIYMYVKTPHVLDSCNLVVRNHILALTP